MLKTLLFCIEHFFILLKNTLCECNNQMKIGGNKKDEYTRCYETVTPNNN